MEFNKTIYLKYKTLKGCPQTSSIFWEHLETIIML